MSNQSFKVKNGLTLSPIDLTTLLSPQAGDLACDINDNNKIKRYDALSASWVEVGSGAAGDVDTLLVQDFDSASLSTFTQTGLTLITVNPLDGRQSARLIHQPLAGAVQSFKETFSVSPKFRGVNMTASLLLRSSASQGNVTVQFRDETNSVDYPSQQLQTNSQEIASLVTNSTTLVSGFSNSVINSLKVGMSVTGSGIPTGTVISSINSTALTITLSQAATASATVSLRFSDLPRTIQLGFQIPENCSSYSYTISALQEAGSPETYVDDIVLKNYWLGMSNQGQSSTEIEVPVVTEWVDYPMVISASTTAPTKGATSVDKAQWRRVGSDMEIRYDFKQTSAGTAGSGTYLFSIPSAYTIDTAKVPSGSADQAVVGIVKLSATTSPTGATTAQGEVLVSKVYSNKLYLTYAQVSVENTADVSSVAYPLNGATLGISFTAKIPISGWTATETQSFITNDLVPAKAVLGNTSLEIPSITGWQGYTPTIQGFGSPTNIEFEYRQVGENVEIRGKFQSGAPTAVEARVGLPAGLSSAGTSLVPSIQVVGKYGATSSMPNSPNGSGSMLAEPSVAYITFSGESTGGLGITKQTGSQLTTNGNYISFFASVPCAGLSATEEVVVSGTQSALVQEADGHYQLNNFTYRTASTATGILYFNDGTLVANIGDHITKLSDSVNGDQFIATKTGIYSINYAVEMGTTSGSIYLVKNSTSNTVSSILSSFYENGSNSVSNSSWTGYLSAGDILRFIKVGGLATFAASDFNVIDIAYQGSLKQLNVSSDQKITIPTSELRFEGASARGTGTEAAIVQFTSLTKLRGDAFTVDNSNGTAITMTKAGLLNVSSSLSLTTLNTFIYLSKNQAIRTTEPTASEMLATMQAYAGTAVVTASASIFVNIGDIIRVCANGAITSDTQNILHLSFQEQDISVSVTNTLPQFSESDSSVRVDTANGYGSTSGNKIPRFSNVRDNIGSDIEYLDSATNGASFTAKSSGIYHVTYTNNTVNAFIGISKNADATDIITNILNIDTSKRLSASYCANVAGYPEEVSWQGYLQAGDIIRPHNEGTTAATSASRTSFTISKVGKPNVTGVDVTPFVNVPQPVTESYVASLNSSIQPLTVLKSNNSSLFTVSAPTAGRVRFTALKTINVTGSGSISFSAAAPGAIAEWYLNGSTQVKFNINYASAGSIEIGAEASIDIILSAGEYIEFRGAQYVGGTFVQAKVSVLATALSDQILTAPETFSTDTASLRYANASEYTLSTLANAPVGTYITFTHAANTNTRTQTTGSNRPSQSDADMNANGMLIYTRAYNVASIASQPSCVAIQIGKGLKGKSLDLYKGTGRVNQGSLDSFNESSTVRSGAVFKDYNESTGILLIDAGWNMLTTITSSFFYFSDGTTQTSGYLVINASKSPALTGVPLLQPRIATLSDVKPSGTSGGSSTAGAYQTRTLNTISDPTSIVTSLTSNQFTLPAGTYYIEASAPCCASNTNKVKIRNITDSSDAILGSAMNNGGPASAFTVAVQSVLAGTITISTSKTFELQHRVTTSRATDGYGTACSFGDDEVYSIVKITKVK